MRRWTTRQSNGNNSPDTDGATVQPPPEVSWSQKRFRKSRPLSLKPLLSGKSNVYTLLSMNPANIRSSQVFMINLLASSWMTVVAVVIVVVVVEAADVVDSVVVVVVVVKVASGVGVQLSFCFTVSFVAGLAQRSTPSRINFSWSLTAARIRSASNRICCRHLSDVWSTEFRARKASSRSRAGNVRALKSLRSEVVPPQHCRRPLRLVS